VKIWRRAREKRPGRDAALVAARAVTGLPLSPREARRFVSATQHYVVTADGTAWAVHDGSVYRGRQTT